MVRLVNMLACIDPDPGLFWCVEWMILIFLLDKIYDFLAFILGVMATIDTVHVWIQTVELVEIFTPSFHVDGAGQALKCLMARLLFQFSFVFKVEKWDLGADYQWLLPITCGARMGLIDSVLFSDATFRVQ